MDGYLTSGNKLKIFRRLPNIYFDLKETFISEMFEM